MSEKQYGFFGNYSSWAEALEDASGYDTPYILERVTKGALKVKNGEAAYEMDSLTYDEPNYLHPFLTYLLYIASCKGNKLKLLDFGGSLGSTYYLYRTFLEQIREFEWNIVEQAHYVYTGKQWFEEGSLKFYYNIEECIQAAHPDVILFSGSLQYLEEPYEFLRQVIEHEFEYIVFDRTPFFDKEDRITVEYVPPFIFDASYPAWFFNYEKFLQFFEHKYELVDQFDSFESWELEDTTTQNKGLLFKRKSSVAQKASNV